MCVLFRMLCLLLKRSVLVLRVCFFVTLSAISFESRAFASSFSRLRFLMFLVLVLVYFLLLMMFFFFVLVIELLCFDCVVVVLFVIIDFRSRFG